MKTSRLIHYLDLFTKYCSLTSAATGGVLIFLMTMLITVDVLGRSTIGKTTLIATEVSGYMLVAIVCLGLAHTERAGKHIEVTLLTRRLSQKRREQLDMVILIISTILISLLAWRTWGPLETRYIGHVTSITSLHTPMWIPYLFIPLGIGLLAIELLTEVIKKLKNLTHYPRRLNKTNTPGR